jgi:hypothetical protein
MDRLHEKDRSIAPFHDSKFPRNEGLRKGLSDRASKSAILVAVVSEAYFTSDYCKLEREAFLSQSQNGEVNSRASIVRYENIEVKKFQDAFGSDMVGHEFYKLDQKNGMNCQELGSKTRFFDSAIVRLRDEIWEKLQSLRKGAERRATLASTKPQIATMLEKGPPGIAAAAPTTGLSDYYVPTAPDYEFDASLAAVLVNGEPRGVGVVVAPDKVLVLSSVLDRHVGEKSLEAKLVFFESSRRAALSSDLASVPIKPD